MKRDPIKQAMKQYYNAVSFKKFKPRFFYTRCNVCGQEFKGETMYECSYHDDYFSMTHYFYGCSECFESKESFTKHCYDNIILPKEAWEYNDKPCTPIVKRMMLAAEENPFLNPRKSDALKTDTPDDNKDSDDKSYYTDMPEDFKQAVEVIKQYCQFEECSDDCANCPHPLKVIRCGDAINTTDSENTNV